MFTPGTRGLSSFKTIFISDPDRAVKDAAELKDASLWSSDEELVASIASRRITGFDRFAELFSTHPNIVKRILALKG
jgi:Zn-dependent protease with chaperone function